VNTPTSEKIVTKLKLTRNEILDLAVSSFSDQLFAEAKRYYDTMKAKKAEVEEIRKEIKKASSQQRPIRSHDRGSQCHLC